MKHITPVLKPPHWLLLSQMIDFKIYFLVYEALHRSLIYMMELPDLLGRLGWIYSVSP